MIFWKSVADELHGHGFKTRKESYNPEKWPTGSTASVKHRRPGLGGEEHFSPPTSSEVEAQGHLPLFPTPPAPSITSLYSRDRPAGLPQPLPEGRGPGSMAPWDAHLESKKDALDLGRTRRPAPASVPGPVLPPRVRASGPLHRPQALAPARPTARSSRP